MNKFEALGLSEPIVKAVTDLGFETPSNIQEQAIPILLEGNADLVGLAQTGTGKTAAFGLPLVNLVNFNSRDTQALILCPTRELCLQITKDLSNYSKYFKTAQITAIYGGASIENQIREIKRGAQVVVATPGRMVDMIERKVINLNTIRYVVLDEADEMLNMGFKEDLDDILAETPDTKNTWLFSATMPAEVSRIARNYMENPKEISVGKKNQGAENIEHIYYVVHARDKYLALKRIADYNPDIFGIIFCRTKAETQEVADALIKDGYNADALHGDLSQAQRDFVMKRYRSRTLQMLVATDVAARGIDVNNITHVINYNLPDDIESYTHRSGRTARAGKKGVSIAIINMKEHFKIKQIERIINKKFTQGVIPDGKDVCERQLFYLVNQLHEVQVNEEEIASYLPKIFEELKDLNKEELIKRFVSEEFNRFSNYYKNAPDLNVNAGRSATGDRPRTSRIFINIGHLDNLNRDLLKDFVSSTANIPLSAVRFVDIKNSYSFIEVSAEHMSTLFAAFENGQQRFNGRTVKLEQSSSSGSGGGGGGNRSFGRSGGRSSDGGSYGKKEGGYGKKEGGSRYPRNKYGEGGNNHREGGQRRERSGKKW